MRPVAGSTSAKTGRPPQYSTALAVAAKVIGGTMTSSPGARSRAATAAWSAAVPLDNATAWRAPTFAANASSNRPHRGPCVIASDRSAARTAARSVAETSCFP